MHTNKRIVALTLLYLFFLLGMAACQKGDGPGKEPLFPGFQAPAHFPSPAYRFDTNPVTEEGFVLGRKLFYDVKLSRNNTISCGSCHIQSSAFTHHGHDVSHGIDDRLGKRNAPPIMNLAWSSSFMWDGGIFDLDLQPLAPISAHEEMDESLENVIAKIKKAPDYPALFKAAFPNEAIGTPTIMKALSQFMVMCVSQDSKYDSVRKGLAHWDKEEAQGYAVFLNHCNGCHKEPLFTDNGFRNNGIGPGYNDDRGRFDVTLDEKDKYLFKVPSLRNLQYTAPYMHDGRFYTLEAVIDQYRDRVKDMPNLDPLLRQEGRTGLAISDEEKKALLSFLRTLNDRHFITYPLLSEQ